MESTQALREALEECRYNRAIDRRQAQKIVTEAGKALDRAIVNGQSTIALQRLYDEAIELAANLNND